MTEAIPVKRRDATSLGEFVAADRAPMRFLQLPKGYIDGLKMEWVSGNSLRVTSGSAYVPSLDRVLELAAPLTKSGLSLSANTWYHVYLFESTGAPDIEIVTTAPAAAFSGTARAKTGDTSRRYLGSIRVGGDSLILNFSHMEGGYVFYRTAAANLLVNGLSTTWVNVSASTIAPSTAVSLRTLLLSNSGLSRFRATGGTYASDSEQQFGVGAGIRYTAQIALDSSQQFSYRVDSGGSAFVEASGYDYAR